MAILLKFTQDDINIVNYERYNHPIPLVQRRMEALWLKSHNLRNTQIAELVDVSENTVRKYLKLYRDEGVDALKFVNFHRPQSELCTNISSLETYFKEHPPTSIKRAQHDIEELTLLKRSHTQVRKFMINSLSMKCRKIGMLPAKADPKEQAEYLKDKLQPRLDEAKAGIRDVFFVDAAHFVLSPFLGYLWSVVKMYIKAPSGRQRFNVLGALNAVTHELITVTNDTYITATEVCSLLEKIAARPFTIPITVFLDNVRYQKCELVFNAAKRLNIELCHLPTYSPNLNLIERLWRFVKKDCLYSVYYPSFAPFKKAIENCLSQTQTKHKSELKSLLTLRFQTFDKTQLLTF